MRIYSDKITTADMAAAFAQARTENGADIYEEGMRSFRSHSTRYGVEVRAASLHGPRRHYGQAGRTASWTDHGYMLAHLFNFDPDARITGYYSFDDAWDFAAKCGQWVPRGQSAAFLDVLECA